MRKHESASVLTPIGAQEILIFIHPVLVSQELSIFILLAQIHYIITQRAPKKLSDCVVPLEPKILNLVILFLQGRDHTIHG